MLRVSRPRVTSSPQRLRPLRATPALSPAGTHWAEATPSRAQWDALSTALVTRVDAAAAGPAPATQALGDDRPSVLVVARSMGCPFCQELAGALSRDVVGPLADAGVTLKLVSIGTPERGLDFCDLTGLPPANLLADPDALLYHALDLERGPAAAFLSPITPLAIGRRVAAGGGASLAAALAKWKPYQPPRGPRQATYQGGAWAFRPGGECVWARCDRATADHADPSEILRRGLELVVV